MNKVLQFIKNHKIVTFIVCIIILASFGSNERQKVDWRTEDNSTMAYIMSEDFAKSFFEKQTHLTIDKFYGRLDSYTHIKRLSLEESKTFVKEGNSHIYFVRSAFIANNIFGGKIIKNYYCYLMQTDEYKWFCIELKIE